MFWAPPPRSEKGIVFWAPPPRFEEGIVFWAPPPRSEQGIVVWAREPEAPIQLSGSQLLYLLSVLRHYNCCPVAKHRGDPMLTLILI